MSEKLLINYNRCYELAEEKARCYFHTLAVQVKQKSFIPTLTDDIHAWKQNHMYRSSFLKYFRKRKPSSNKHNSYLKWLDYTGKLDPYLDRTVSYLYMRDLGKDLNDLETKNRVQHVVKDLKKNISQRVRTSSEDQFDGFYVTNLYRKAQQEGIISTYIWLMEKLQMVSAHIPKEMDAVNALRKLIKIIAGVLMHVVEEMDDAISSQERRKRLDEAIRLGYSYGLTYPFIDDLLDAKILSTQEQQEYSELIRTTLITGQVPSLGEWQGENSKLIEFIHKELGEAFEYIKAQQREETIKSFLEQAYIFFQSQEVDRRKELSNSHYRNEDIYIPVILKSSSSRLIVRNVLGAPAGDGFENRTFYYGIYNQLADDFADLFDDLKDGAVTPYTYYWKYHENRPDLINPFEMYWTVIAHLIHEVYGSNPKVREVILSRAINGLKRFKAKVGTQKFQEIMAFFTSGMPTFWKLIQRMVQKADDVDFFDKLLRDQMIYHLQKEQKEQEEFREMVETARDHINTLLPIPKQNHKPLLQESITNAANYSLAGDGKRLRPIITWMMGVNHYGFRPSSLVPLLKSLEYMHTASLIFDDLPSQDNAPARRGRPTLHKVYNTAIAELTGLFLTQKAIEEQTELHDFDADIVLQLIQYTARATAEMCKGQAMDLESIGKQLTLEQLNTMCFYKTGLAFEAALIMPAILACADEQEIKTLKKYAYHAGIAFQIKDDLLDVEGDKKLLGKPIGIDTENNQSTFVTILGIDEAKKSMWEHYCLAMEALDDAPKDIPFLKYLMKYIVNRDR